MTPVNPAPSLCLQMVSKAECETFLVTHTFYLTVNGPSSLLGVENRALNINHTNPGHSLASGKSDYDKEGFHQAFVQFAT